MSRRREIQHEIRERGRKVRRGCGGSAGAAGVSDNGKKCEKCGKSKECVDVYCVVRVEI